MEQTIFDEKFGRKTSKTKTNDECGGEGKGRVLHDKTKHTFLWGSSNTTGRVFCFAFFTK